MSSKKITIVLAEDHKIVRKGLKALLELEPDITVVDEAGDGLEAIKIAKRVQPMLIIMDIALPRLNGLEASRQILKASPQTKILVLSAHSDDGYIEKASSLGVWGFLIKQCSPNLLIEAVREIVKGNHFFSPTIFERLNFLNRRQLNRAGSLKDRVHNLSGREAQVLQLVAEGKANKQIASDLEICIKTVEKHRQNLMKKLLIHDTAGLTRYAISEGIIENSSQQTTL